MTEHMLGTVGYEMNYPAFFFGLIAAMENGTTVHARNIDYPLLFEHIAIGRGT